VPPLAGGTFGIDGEETMAKKTVKVTQVKSTAKRLKAHKACVAGLGLRRIGHTVEVEDTPSVRGMIDKVNYLVKVEGE
jgi:large subunit ribosomal protein L30